MLFCSLTVAAAAQDVPPASISAAPAPQAVVPGSARHLDDAAAVIKMVSDSNLNGDGRKRLAELQRHFAELVESYQKNPNAFTDPAAGGDDRDDNKDRTGADNWKESFTLVERDLSGILGAGPALPGGAPANATPAIAVTTAPARGGAVAGTTGQLPQASTAGGNGTITPSPTTAVDPAVPQPATTSGSPAPNTQAASNATTAGSDTTASAAGAVATTGAAPTTGAASTTGTINGGMIAGAIGVKNLDPEVRRQLEEFRLHVELFFAASTMNLERETTR